MLMGNYIHALGQAKSKISKLITYSHNSQLIHDILVHWIPFGNGDKAHNSSCHSNPSK
jgi:hypothetical protein